MKQLIKINTIPLATESDFITYKGAVTLFLVNRSIETTDPILYKKIQLQLESIHEDIQSYDLESDSDERDEILLRIYLKRSKLNNKLIKYLIRDHSYSSSSYTSGSSLY